MRMTIGTPVVPFERYRYLAMCEMTWSRAGYENASNCISQTGFHPAWVRPSETPAMAASARGVSNTRCSPNSAWRPSVMRKTPPSLPMSSPRISTRSSPANESRSARFSAWAIVTSAIAVLLGEPENLVALPDQDGWQLGEDPPEQILDVAGRGALDAGPHRGGQVLPLRLGLEEHRLVGDPRRLQKHPEPLDGIELLPRLDVLLGAVSGGVVGGGVWPDPVGDGLDERGLVLGASPLHGLAGHPVHGEDIVPVDAHAGEAVPLRFPVDLPGGLLLQRHGDGPGVVLTEEDDRRPEHPGHVHGLVHVALRGGSVAEVRDRNDVLPVELRAQRVPGSVQRLAAHRDGEHAEAGPNRIVDAAVPRPSVELHVLDHVEATADGHPHLPVGGVDHVSLAEGIGAPDLGRLLADGRWIHGQFALPLQRRTFEIDVAGQDHVPEELPQVL